MVGPGSQRVELQCAPHEMHEIAEFGIAAHALYKDGLSPDKGIRRRRATPIAWLRRTIANLAEGDPEEFLENTKLELFHDQVFCFTPKGRLIALPRGATPIDFAYAVHTELGNGMVGCKINGRHRAARLRIAQRRRGRGAFHRQPGPARRLGITRRHRKGESRDPAGHPHRGAPSIRGLGRQLVERAFQRAGRAFSDDNLKAALPRLARASVEDVLAAVGRGEMASSDVLRALYPDYQGERAHVVSEPAPKGIQAGSPSEIAGPIFKPAATSSKAQPPTDVPVIGLGADLPVRFAEGARFPATASSASSPRAKA